MHLKRQEATTKLPISRKGTKYVARALSNLKDSVPVVIAIRDMLKLARTTAEVKKMIHHKLIKINGRIVKDHRESIKLFNLLEADKLYALTVLPTGKFALEEAKDKNLRLCKIVNKNIIKGSSIQLNLHDGSNIISKDKFAIGDSVYLDLSGKVREHIQLVKGKEALIIDGKYLGMDGKIESVSKDLVTVNLEGSSKIIPQRQVIVR